MKKNLVFAALVLGIASMVSASDFSDFYGRSDSQSPRRKISRDNPVLHRAKTEADMKSKREEQRAITRKVSGRPSGSSTALIAVEVAKHYGITQGSVFTLDRVPVGSPR